MAESALGSSLSQISTNLDFLGGALAFLEVRNPIKEVENMRIPTIAGPARRDRRQRPMRGVRPSILGLHPQQADADDDSSDADMADDAYDDGADATE